MTDNLSPYAETIFQRTYAISEKEDWQGCAGRVSKFVANGDAELEKKFFDVISKRKFIPGGRYLYSAGRELSQCTNCFLMQVEDSREGWAELVSRHILALSLGGGVGTEYSKIRGRGEPIARYGGEASGAVSLASMVNEIARNVKDGGQRRAALIAILAWWHPDIEEFITVKNWPTHIRALKEDDFNFPAPLDCTNISVRLDPEFFKSIKKDDATKDLYYRIVKNMCKTGEPGLSIDVGKNKNNILRNPCGEITSDTPYDCCNLGSINLSRITDLSELEDTVRIAVRFLYLGTYRGSLPHPDFQVVRESNRRIGLGLMGLHELCLKNDLKYEPSGLIGRWLHTWEKVSDEEAKKVAGEMNDVVPVAVRAVAPTGTTSIIGETTSGIEPILCVSYKRRYLDKGGKWRYQYVVDPTAARLIQEGIVPDDIEDAYLLSRDVEKRLSMQVFVQEYTDQAIASTVNLPEFGEAGNNNAKRFSETLLKYLPKLRGVTVFPEGSRPGQPITPVKYETALKHKDVVFEEDGDRCKGSVCSI